MTLRRLIFCIALAASVDAGALAYAQDQGSKSDMPGMKEMTDAKPGTQDHGMGGMDMNAMMKQCADMRGQMKPGAPMPPDMQKIMAQCDEMDRSMGADQPYKPPEKRTR